MPNARNAEAEARAHAADDLVDADVPAAVVCAQCGSADCPGCFQEQTRSGVVAVVPWERPGAGAVARLWATARATTHNAAPFFEALPDGPLGPALRFAIVTELLAAGSMLLLLAAPVAAVFPGWAAHLVITDSVFVVRVGIAVTTGLAALLVAAHAGYGWALHVGARRAGALGSVRRAVRFGLYSTGWDLVLGPLGVAALAFEGGARAVLSIFKPGIGVGLPGRCARAFVRGAYGLEGDGARPALRASFAAAAVATAVGAIAAVVVAIALVMR